MLSDALSNLLENRLELERVLDEILEQAIAIMGAERGFVVYFKERGSLIDGGTFECLAVKDFDHSKIDEPNVQFSRTVVWEVVRNREAVVLMNALGSEQFGSVESVGGLGLRSIAAVPLVVDDDVVGVLYLENRSLQGVFRKNDLGLLEAFARVAALALANAGVAQACNKAVQQSRQKSAEQVVQNFSHELRTPLNSIFGFAQLLAQTEPLSERQRSYLVRIIEGGEALGSILDTLLHAVRVDLGAPLDLVDLDLGVVLKGSIDDLADTAKSKGVTVEFRESHSPARGDLELLQRLFGNLLRNAVEHSEVGGRVSVALEKQAEGYLICFRDFGAGIAAEEQKRAFLKYEQGEQADHKGLGLGLYLSRLVAERHQGRLWLESEGVGSGCEFFVWLPEKLS